MIIEKGRGSPGGGAPERQLVIRLVRFGGCLGFAFGVCMRSALAGVEDEPIRLESYSDFGSIGLLQTPTARFGEDGEFAFGVSRVAPNIRTAVTFQPLPWAEATLRYTTVLNRLYGPESFSGNQTLKDRGFDVKLRLAEEGSIMPGLAVGLRDIGGTGLFSSEYLVASKRYYDWDWSLGMAWGNLGTRGHLPNPMLYLSEHFRFRQTNVGQGGTVQTGTFFSGERVGLFGGVSYRLFGSNEWLLKLEYDSNDYQHEAHGNNQEVKSPINAALVYRPNSWMDFSVGVERGNAIMFQLVAHTNLKTNPGMPKTDPAPQPIKPRPPVSQVDVISSLKVSQDLTESLKREGFSVDSVEVTEKRAVARVSQKRYRKQAQAIGRAARAMANTAPASVEQLVVVNQESGIAANRVALLRTDLEAAERGEGSPAEIYRRAVIEGPAAASTDGEGTVANPNRYPNFEWRWAPAMRQHIGGPDNPYFYQFWLRLDGDLELARGLSATGTLGLDIANNLSGLKLPSDSQLPHVRSDIKEYLKQGKSNIVRLQADYMTHLGDDWFGRASVGLFEEMFGGIGGEVLYRPFGERWAAGVDFYRVRQRDFDQRFNFRSYGVATGHADIYYKLPFYNLNLRLSAGRYLAGDIGYTIDMSRRLESGIQVGGFVTLTNVSAQQFGEGSFDKGVYVNIPMDFVSLFSSRGQFGLGWRPLTRDGGQRLVVGKQLYSTLESAQPDNLVAGWDNILK